MKNGHSSYHLLLGFRNLGLLLLLCIFLFNTGGNFFYIKVLQYFLQEDMRQKINEGLDEKDLLCIIVSKQEIHQIGWKEKGKEFTYRGEMYDVVKTETRGDKTCYYCINDKKESLLIAGFVRHHKENESLRKIIKNADTIKFISQKTSAVVMAPEVLISFPILKQAILSAVQEICDPPPKTA